LKVIFEEGEGGLNTALKYPKYKHFIWSSKVTD